MQSIRCDGSSGQSERIRVSVLRSVFAFESGENRMCEERGNAMRRCGAGLKLGDTARDSGTVGGLRMGRQESGYE